MNTLPYVYWFSCLWIYELFLGFPYDSAGKEFTYNVGDLGSIPELGRSPGEGKGYPVWSYYE